ncbi:MAG: hypothetical protein ACFB10_13200 [Salibacteraceae bacterium]
MDVNSFKLELLTKLLAVENKVVLKKVEDLLNDATAAGYSAEGEAMTRSELNAKLDEGIRQALAGDGITTDALRKTVDSWREGYQK